MARSFTTTGDVVNSSIVAGNTGTIALWLKPNWNSGDAGQMFFFDSLGSASDSPSIQRFTDTNIYAGFTSGGNSRVVVADTGLFTSGAWGHWSFTWSSSAGQTLYKSASSLGNVGYSNFTNSNTSLDIGNTASSSPPENRPFNGAVDDFAMWNVILSAGELAALAAGLRPGAIRPLSLLCWLSIGTASPEPDLSGNVKNGTVSGTALVSGAPVTMFTPRWRQFPEIPAAAFKNRFFIKKAA